MRELMFLNRQYSYVESVFIQRKLDFECGHYDLEVRLVDFPNIMGTALKIKFCMVSDFQMKNLDGLYRVSFEITDVSNRQLENIRYLIKDSENLIFSFSCDEIMYDVIRD